MGEVASLSVTEPVRVDSRRVRDIVAELGDAAAEGVVQLALEQMASSVAQLQAGAGGMGHEAFAAQAERLSRLAWQVGLVSLAAVAVDVADCARRADETALAATLARTARIANSSLNEIWAVLAL